MVLGVVCCTAESKAVKSLIIPASNQLFGLMQAVDDGVFLFLLFSLPFSHPAFHVLLALRPRLSDSPRGSWISEPLMYFHSAYVVYNTHIRSENFFAAR